uniref:Uncharacterized protein n=1 Tax=Rhizophora mucronata TaxID=61149 RepID=A0A2P2NMP1_RHIMU
MKESSPLTVLHMYGVCM